MSRAAPSRGGGLLISAALAVAIVLGFFLGVELVLRLAGVDSLAGADPFAGFSRLVRVFRLDAARGVRATEPAAARRSFLVQEFAARKPPGGYRVFVLGGSSARGFPWGGPVAFSRALADALKATHPGRSIEVVNAAAMSYGSNRLRVLAHELLEYEPDALVLYEAHNEFIESRFYGRILSRPAALDPIRSLLHHSRLYSAMARAFQALRPGASVDSSGASPGDLLGVDVAREDATGIDDSEKRRVLARMEENLEAILDLARSRGVRVVLCTVASNLRDWRPHESLFASGRDPASRQQALERLGQALRETDRGDPGRAAGLLQEASRLAPEHAEIQFQRGRALEAMQRWEEARAAYVLARDADARPARAPSSFNEAIRRLAARHDAVLVDVERLFEEESPHGLVGFNLLEDYVHPTPAGHRLIARALWEAFLTRGLTGQARQAPASEFLRATGPILEGESLLEAAGREGRQASYLFNLAVVLEHQGLADQAIRNYRACLRLNPAYDAAAYNLGLLLQSRGEHEEAIDLFRRTLSAQPRHAAALSALGMSLASLGDLPAALQALEEAVRIDPDSAMAHTNLGFVHTRAGRIGNAEESFRRAVALAPDHPVPLANLGTALLRQGRAPEAIPFFRRSLAADHAGREAREGLARALEMLGRHPEALSVRQGAPDVPGQGD